MTDRGTNGALKYCAITKNLSIVPPKVDQRFGGSFLCILCFLVGRPKRGQDITVITIIIKIHHAAPTDETVDLLEQNWRLQLLLLLQADRTENDFVSYPFPLIYHPFVVGISSEIGYPKCTPLWDREGAILPTWHEFLAVFLQDATYR